MNPKHNKYALRYESAGRMARYKAARRNLWMAVWLFIIGVVIATFMAEWLAHAEELRQHPDTPSVEIND